MKTITMSLPVFSPSLHIRVTQSLPCVNLEYLNTVVPGLGVSVWVMWKEAVNAVKPPSRDDKMVSDAYPRILLDQAIPNIADHKWLGRHSGAPNRRDLTVYLDPRASVNGCSQAHSLSILSLSSDSRVPHRDSSCPIVASSDPSSRL